MQNRLTQSLPTCKKRRVGRRQREWAKKRRLQLIEELGGECAGCGETDPSKLVIDHWYGRDWDLRKKDPSARVSRYILEARLGLVGLLCFHCNPRFRTKSEESDTEPF